MLWKLLFNKLNTVLQGNTTKLQKITKRKSKVIKSFFTKMFVVITIIKKEEKDYETREVEEEDKEVEKGQGEDEGKVKSWKEKEKVRKRKKRKKGQVW